MLTSRPSWARGLKLYRYRGFALISVAPLVGAWVETSSWVSMRCGPRSRPSWARGLKRGFAWLNGRSLNVAPLVGAWVETLPLWVGSVGVGVAPLVGAWVETTLLLANLLENLSRPSWARGLKPCAFAVTKSGAKVAPLVGAWVETLFVATYLLLTTVAPLVGAWVKTLLLRSTTYY